MTPLARPSRKRSSAAELNRGLSNGAEFAGVVLVFFFGGFGLDKWLGTAPWCAVGLTIFGVVGVFVRTWYAYSAEMDRLQQQRSTHRTVGTPVTTHQTEGHAA